MILGRNWRLSVNNQSSVNVDVTITARRWKFASDGSVTYESSEATVYNQSAIASSTTAWTRGTAQDNSTDKWIGADLLVAITPASSATLNVTVQLEENTDGTPTNWPREGGGLGLGGCATASAVTGAQRYNLTAP